MRIRRFRRELGLTQTAMAGDLGVSPSYLNLIERNQRPLSAQVLLRLNDVYDIDVKELSGEDDARTAASLKEVFSDSLFQDLRIGNDELTDLVGTSPDAAQAVLTLYRAYRETMTNAAAVAEQMADGEIPVDIDAVPFPTDGARDFFHHHNNHFPELETAAENLWADALDGTEDLGHSLRQHLKRAYGIAVKVMPIDVMPDVVWRFDRHTSRLFLSEMLGQPGRVFQLAFQVGIRSHRNLFDDIIARSGVAGDEAAQLCRLGLANYFAGAVMMPYERFLNAAEKLRYDTEVLTQRFAASYEQVCHRLTTLQRPGSRGVPFFFVRVDRAGNISKRFSSGGFHFARFGGTCPRWNVHEAFRTPGKIVTQVVQMEDRTTYFSVSRTVTGLGGGFHLPEQQLAIGMGCEIGHARRLVYADGLD
ncbi:MAG: short-chain fatty acyl-CoA regulator family protein, partial [Kiloniellaceae bacterium]